MVVGCHMTGSCARFVTDLLTKEQLSVRETKIANAMQVQRQDRPERST